VIETGGRRWRRALLAALLALLAWGRAPRDARAGGEPALIAVNVESCPNPWDRAFRSALAVELGDERLAAGHTEAPGAATGDRLSVRCDAQRVQVVARDAETAATLERTLPVGDLPAATAPRVVALAAVELLAVFDPVLRRRLEASGSPPPAAPATPPEHRLSLTAGAVYRAFLADAGIHAWGAELDARRASRSQRWGADLGVEIASDGHATSIGQTSALLASARLTAGARVRLAADRLALSFDLGGRVGAARLSGVTRDPNVVASTVVRPWAGPVATVTAQLTRYLFCVQFAAEAGWAAVAASGLVNEGPTLAASGPWLAISLSGNIRP
jgi:hypothetical protein